MGFRLVPKSVILNDLERRNGHYIPTRNRRVDLWRNLCTSLLYSVVGIRCRRKESSRSLSHLLMSFLYHFAGSVSTTANTKCLYFKCIRKKHV